MLLQINACACLLELIVVESWNILKVASCIMCIADGVDEAYSLYLET